MDKVAGLLLDLKLLQLDLLEALATALRQQLEQQEAAGAGTTHAGIAATAAAAGGDDEGFGGSSTSADEVRMLLVEAETIAGELYGVS